MAAKQKNRTQPDFKASGATERFSRASRLLKHSAFERVYKDGRRHFSGNMTVFYVLQPAGGVAAGARVGFTVGRGMGDAVERNRLKRRLRDITRRNLACLNQALAERGLAAEVVIHPRKPALTAEHSILFADVARAFQVIAAAKSSPEAPPSR